MANNTEYYVEVLELDDNVRTTPCEDIENVLHVVASTIVTDIVTVFDSDWNELTWFELEDDGNPYDDYDIDEPYL